MNKIRILLFSAVAMFATCENPAAVPEGAQAGFIMAEPSPAVSLRNAVRGIYTCSNNRIYKNNI